jgi:hypothetical protein
MRTSCGELGNIVAGVYAPQMAKTNNRQFIGGLFGVKLPYKALIVEAFVCSGHRRVREYCPGCSSVRRRPTQPKEGRMGHPAKTRQDGVSDKDNISEMSTWTKPLARRTLPRTAAQHCWRR